jgi:hypothetical protein
MPSGLAGFDVTSQSFVSVARDNTGYEPIRTYRPDSSSMIHQENKWVIALSCFGWVESSSYTS